MANWKHKPATITQHPSNFKNLSVTPLIHNPKIPIVMICFRSFRGEDTRNSFTTHLYKELCTKGINTFIDNDKFERGDDIASALVAAIENSKFSVIVLSENYASSRWCLEELVKILECIRTKGQRVLPIFYNVDPSHIRYHKRKFWRSIG